jgi:uncharacterized Zn finger protein
MDLTPEPDRRAVSQYVALRCPPCDERTVHTVAEVARQAYIRCTKCGLVRQDASEETGIVQKRRKADG